MKKSTARIVLPWHRGERTLAEGYSVSPMPEPWCYRISRPQEKVAKNPDGLTVAYHVCIYPTHLSCDCPDFAQHGHQRHCKHLLAALVQVWRWSQSLSPIADVSGIMTELGIDKLRDAALAYESRRGAQEQPHQVAPERPPFEDYTCGAERTAECVCASAPTAPELPALTPGDAITTAGGRTAYVRPASDYGSRPWPRNREAEGVELSDHRELVGTNGRLVA